MQVSVKELRDHLSLYLHKVENGEEIIITSHRKPVAQISPIDESCREVISREQFVSEIHQMHNKLKGIKLKKSMRDTVLESRKQERS